MDFERAAKQGGSQAAGSRAGASQAEGRPKVRAGQSHIASRVFGGDSAISNSETMVGGSNYVAPATIKPLLSI